MQISNRFAQVSALAFGIAGALAMGQAQASAFQLKENSVKAQGRAMAGSASAKGDASVVVNNPAVMSTFEQKAVQADVSAIDLSFEFSGGGTAAAGTPLARPLTGGDGGDAGGLAAVPAMSFVLPLDGAFDRLTLGAMVSAPFGLKTDYDKDWVGRYHALESDVKIIDLTLAASVALSDRFSAGLGLIYSRADVTLSNAVDFGSAICRVNVAACVTPNPVAAPFGPQKNDGFAEIHGTDNSIGWLVGLNFRPTDNLSLGYSHRSELDYELRGTATFDKPANVSALLGVAIPNQYVTTGGGADLTTPSIDTFSATWQATDRLALMAETSKTDWHSLKEIRIEFDSAQPDSVEDYSWGDSWFYAVGGEYKFSDTFTARAGVARDDSPVSLPHRTPRMPDQDRMWYSLGLTWNATPNLEVSASYVKIDLVDTPEVNILSSSGSRLVGEYDGAADIYGISAQYRF